MVEKMNENQRRMIRIVLVIVAVIILVPNRPSALHREALDELATSLEAKVFRLKIDIHVPDLAGESMQVPTLEGRGWHHNNPAGAVALKAGTNVEVTGVYNYAERGFLLELATEDTSIPKKPITARPRSRIRIMVQAPGTVPDAQRAEAV